MKFGCCLNMISGQPDGMGIEYLEELADLGYDYVELPLAEVTALSEEEFQVLKERLHKKKIACEACNNFFSKSMRLTGPDVDQVRIMAYVRKALKRAQELGVQVVVFGSGPAKNVPDGFPIEQGYRQVVELLRQIEPLAVNAQITIVIEPLRKAECNLIHTFKEGCRLARDVGREGVKVLVDFYHLSVEREPVENIIEEGGEYLRHVHFACPVGRVYPADIEEAPYLPFINALKQIGYRDRVSCEAYSKSYHKDGLRTLDFFRKYF